MFLFFFLIITIIFVIRQIAIFEIQIEPTHGRSLE